MQVGFSCVLARNTGSYASPVWDDVDNVRDATLDLSSTQADASRRGGGGWHEDIQGLHSASLEFDMVYDNDDPQFVAFRTAWLDRTGVEILALDGGASTSGSQGLHATMGIFNFARNEPLDDTVTVSVTMAPTPNANHSPEWYTATGSETTTEEGDGL